MTTPDPLTALRREWNRIKPDDEPRMDDDAPVHLYLTAGELRAALASEGDGLDAPDPLTYSEEYRRGWYVGWKAAAAPKEEPHE